MKITTKISDMLKSGKEYVTEIAKSRGKELFARLAVITLMTRPTPSHSMDIMGGTNTVLNVAQQGINLFNTGGKVQNRRAKVGNGKNINTDMNNIRGVVKDLSRGNKNLENITGVLGMGEETSNRKGKYVTTKERMRQQQNQNYNSSYGYGY